METYHVHGIKRNIFSRRKMTFDSFWNKTTLISSFFYPWNDETPPSLIFRALHDNRNLYFRFDVIDSEIIVDKKTVGKMAVLDSDRVEIFFRTGKEMNPYYGLEMDPLGRVLDYKAEYYRKFDYNWHWEGIKIFAYYTLNGYRVMGIIPIESLRELNLLHNNRLQAGLFRGKCISLPGERTSFKWISWMDPKTDKPDFHVPAAFGEIVLDEGIQ